MYPPKKENMCFICLVEDFDRFVKINCSMNRIGFILVLVIAVNFDVLADHIVGGYIGMEQQNKQPGKYRFTLNILINHLYFATGESQRMQTDDYYIRIYSKRDNKEQLTLKVTFQGYKDLTFANISCANLLNLTTRVYTYQADENLDINAFDDDSGYYIAFERCCRERSIVNLEKPEDTGFAFYTEFPSLKKYPTFSSPAIEVIEGDFGCNRVPFKRATKFVDSDGDQLVFSLITPLKGGNTLANARDYTKPGPYALATWKNPFSENRIIWGIENLTINTTSGELSVNTNDVGAYAVAIQILKIRGGVVIGKTIFDYQLFVAPCVLVTPPTPIIQFAKTPVENLQLCRNDSIIVEAGSYQNNSYQWYKDDVLLEGQVLNRLRIRESGVYKVVTNFIDSCGVPATSKELNVTKLEAYTPKLLIMDSTLCKGDTINLIATGVQTSNLEWNINGSVITGKDTIQLNYDADVRVKAISTSGCTSKEEKVSIKFNNPPPLLINFQSSYQVCKDDSLAFPLTNSTKFEWIYTDTLGNGSQLLSKKFLSSEGTYQLKITDDNRCSSISPKFQLVKSNLPSIRFTIPDSVCYQAGELLLKAMPSGGTFSGKWVNGESLSIRNAGEGFHTIFYTLNANSSCVASDTFKVFVPPVLKTDLVDEALVSSNQSYLITLKTSSNPTHIKWTPSDFLDNPSILQPTISPATEGVYRVELTDEFGCMYSDSIEIKTFSKIIIPNAFTPNDDGLNETWEIDGIELYPNVEVYIYNLWGQELFFSKGYDMPWDGRFKNKRVEAGIYFYKVDTKQNGVSFQGVLQVLD